MRKIPLFFSILILFGPFFSVFGSGASENLQKNLSIEKNEPANIDLILKISRQYSDLIGATSDSIKAKNYAQKSLEYAQRAATLEPDNAEAHLSLAIAYGKLTDFVDNKTKLEYSRLIKAEAERTLVLDPKKDFAYYVLGRWHRGIAELNPVLKALAKVIYGSLPPSSFEEAVKNLEQAVKLAPQKIIHRAELARIYEMTGEKEKALAEWKQVLKLLAVDADDEREKKTAREKVK